MKLRFIVAAVVAVVLAGGVGFSQEQGAFKFEGAWVARVPGMPGQWSYVVSPDPSGRRASITGSIEVGISAGAFYPPFAAAEYQSPLIGEAVITDQGTGTFNSVWYGLKKLTGQPVSAQVVYIAMNRGEITPAGPGKSTGTHHLMFYLPSSDADGDGFPDPSEQPVFTVPLTTVDTRLPPPVVR